MDLPAAAPADPANQRTADGADDARRAIGPVRVTASALRVRREPTTAYRSNIFGRLPHGSVVTPSAKAGDWLRIDHRGQDGFIHGGHVVPVEVEANQTPPALPSPAPGEDDAHAAREQEPAHTVEPQAPLPDGESPQAAPAPDATAPTPAPAREPAPTPAPVNATPEPAKPPAPAPAPANPAPDPAKAPAPTNATPDPANTPAPAPASASPTLSGTYKGMFSKVYDTGSQKVQVFVSPGGLSPTPNIYLHFHGHYADYGIDPDLEWDARSGPKDPKDREKPVSSGIDQARAAMKSAQDKNTIAILPQGLLGQGTQVKGDYSHEGGYMEDLERQGLPGFLAKILGPLAKDLAITGGLTPGNIGIGGHSAGGYMGAHSALSKAGALADAITDLTFFDASYAARHLEDAKTWMMKGKPGKNLRIVNGWAQQSEHSARPDWRDNWFSRFGPGALELLAKSKGMTVRHLAIGEKLDPATKVMQHSQVINKSGAVQCDVLVTMTSLPGGKDHEPLRDRYIDDAMMSIAGGEKGNQEYGHYQAGKLDKQASTAPTPGKAAAPGATTTAAPDASTAAAPDASRVVADDHDDDDRVADGHDVPLPQSDPGPAKSDDAVDPKVHTLPQAEHVEGDGTGPEPVKPPPTAAAAPAPAKAKTAHLVEGDHETVKRGLYGKDGKDGLISRDKLGRQSFAKVKGKKEKVEINLTDDQYDFKQRVYDAAIKTLGKQLYGGVNEKELDPIGHGQRIRKAVVGPLNDMLRAMKRALPAGHDVWVGSGYRDPVEDFSIWDNKFDEIYLWATKKERERRWPEKPFGPEAVAYTVEQIAPRKAPPGGSNHSNGIAVDLHISINGKDVPVSFSDQRAYKATPQYDWLFHHARQHHFENWYKEAWHYDYKP